MKRFIPVFALLGLMDSALASGQTHFRAESIPSCKLATSVRQLPPGAEIRIKVVAPSPNIGLGVAMRVDDGLRHVFTNGLIQPGALSFGQVISYKVVEPGSYALYSWGKGISGCADGAVVVPVPVAGFDSIGFGPYFQIDAKVVWPEF